MWEAKRKAGQERMRWKGTSWESLLGGKHLGFEVPVEPQGRYGCLSWQELFVCVRRRVGSSNVMIVYLVLFTCP